MQCDKSTHNHYTVLSFSGEIDLSVSPDARKYILDSINKNENLLIDLSGVEYIDSSGVASLVEGFQNARSRMLDFALLGLSDSAMQVLQLSRLDTVFKIYDSLDDIN